MTIIPLSQLSLSSTPAFLWNAYFEYLWSYKPDSWVGRFVSAFRILAALLVLPIVVLVLLDISSYVIARTLGIVDDVKAATSDISKHALTVGVGAIADTDTATLTPHVSRSSFLSDFPSSTSISEGTTPGEDVRTSHVGSRPAGNLVPSLSELEYSHLQAFFATEETGHKLAGVGSFSPAVSLPPSPIASRLKLPSSGIESIEEQGNDEGNISDEYFVVRRRTRQAEDSVQSESPQ